MIMIILAHSKCVVSIRLYGTKPIPTPISSSEGYTALMYAYLVPGSTAAFGQSLISTRELLSYEKNVRQTARRGGQWEGKANEREKGRLGFCHRIDSSRLDTLVLPSQAKLPVTVEATSSDFALDRLPHPTSDRSAKRCCYCCCGDRDGVLSSKRPPTEDGHHGRHQSRTGAQTMPNESLVHEWLCRAIYLVRTCWKPGPNSLSSSVRFQTPTR